MRDRSLAVRVLDENVSRDECLAMRYLYAEGCTGTDIAFMLERDEKTVYWHPHDECLHRWEVER